MAVPKKRTSKSKKKTRKANWKKKANKEAQKSLALAKSVLQGKSTTFLYTIYINE
uniref:Large ribosomal subunit protein bL32c n=1 Tax=Biddulphia biddulphiana TaxID=1158022 RepID=A0A2U9NSN2_9STRA|nr:ribosomal protein L32 [Biddulphia biddulphiana]AWT40131.1 ribosomal protein L32 [Biddulphia biddulphiana]